MKNKENIKISYNPSKNGFTLLYLSKKSETNK